VPRLAVWPPESTYVTETLRSASVRSKSVIVAVRYAAMAAESMLGRGFADAPSWRVAAGLVAAGLGGSVPEAAVAIGDGDGDAVAVRLGVRVPGAVVSLGDGSNDWVAAVAAGVAGDADRAMVAGAADGGATAPLHALRTTTNANPAPARIEPHIQMLLPVSDDRRRRKRARVSSRYRLITDHPGSSVLVGRPEVPKRRTCGGVGQRLDHAGSDRDRLTGCQPSARPG
jgi:hypothetical protein